MVPASTMLDQVTMPSSSNPITTLYQLHFSLLDIADSTETEKKNYIYATVQPKSSTEVTRSPCSHLPPILLSRSSLKSVSCIYIPGSTQNSTLLDITNPTQT